MPPYLTICCVPARGPLSIPDRVLLSRSFLLAESQQMAPRWGVWATELPPRSGVPDDVWAWAIVKTFPPEPMHWRRLAVRQEAARTRICWRIQVLCARFRATQVACKHPSCHHAEP